MPENSKQIQIKSRKGVFQNVNFNQEGNQKITIHLRVLILLFANLIHKCLIKCLRISDIIYDGRIMGKRHKVSRLESSVAEDLKELV